MADILRGSQPSKRGDPFVCFTELSAGFLFLCAGKGVDERRFNGSRRNGVDPDACIPPKYVE